MSRFTGPMDILKLLDKSNCRDCGEATCLAFAAAVFTGKRHLSECPRLSNDVVERFAGDVETRAPVDQDLDALVAQLKGEISAVDLSSVAERLGATFGNGKLTMKVLGKDFTVDEGGNLSSDIHVHPWVTIPVLTYIISGAGIPVSGTWVPFRELRSGKTWYRLFEQRCEKPLKRVADAYTDLFEDMVRIFNGRQVENYSASDISLVLHPLPKVPVLICYWKPDEGLASDLHVFFDAAAEDNVTIEGIYALGTGLVRMFEKFALRHGTLESSR
ncbi:MAG: DUF3786 domain-containing protein [Thermodesulfobacteriota bacterium]|nr:DUF3786 domain-containing protein [Thermodesulfobacteriota bacterium]